jgi:hypothetical protein
MMKRRSDFMRDLVVGILIEGGDPFTIHGKVGTTILYMTTTSSYTSL